MIALFLPYRARLEIFINNSNMLFFVEYMAIITSTLLYQSFGGTVVELITVEIWSYRIGS